MRSLFFAILIYQSCSLPIYHDVARYRAVAIYRSVRINYKIVKRKTTRFVGPVANRIVSYDMGDYNENVQQTIKDNYHLAKDNTKQLFYKRVDMLMKNQNEIIDRSVSIISDNVVNEFLYLMKAYHLTNDDINSYMYILGYEVIWVGYKLLRINTKDKADITNPTEAVKNETNLLYQQVIINILLYVIIKNLIMNSIILALNAK